MIQFRKLDNKVKVHISSNLGVDYVTSIGCHDDDQFAMLLRDHLQTKMYDMLEEIRRQAYNDGWNDKQKRKPKQTWFRGSWS